MTADTKAALKKSLSQEDAALRERMPPGPESTPAPAPDATAEAGAAVAKATTAKATRATKATKATKATQPEAAPAKAAPARAARKAQVVPAKPASPQARTGRSAQSKGAAVVPAGQPGTTAPSAPAALPKSKPVKAKVMKAGPVVEAAKFVKVSRESFSLPATEAATLKALRTALAKEGRIATKSELVRAGIALLTGLAPGALAAAVDGLAPVVKKKKKK